MTEKSQFPINTLARQENEEMVEWVKLSPHDLEVIIEISQRVVDYKYQALSPKNWQIFESEYLPSLVDQISVNEFKVADPQKNALMWLSDQICHSRQVIEGTKLRDGMPLADTRLGEQALEILRHAHRGQISYDSYKHNLKFRQLFTDE